MSAGRNVQMTYTARVGAYPELPKSRWADDGTSLEIANATGTKCDP